MNLVWHIAKKDVRRLALPASLWLAFILGTTIWFRVSSPGAPGQNAAGVFEWVGMMRIWTKMLVIGTFVTGFLIAGTLAVEDPLLGADQFWMTRPIGNARLLAGKSIAMLLLFVVAPLALFAVIDLAIGCKLRELTAPLVDNVPWFFAAALLALLLGSLARTLAQFLFQTIGAFVALALANFLFVEMGLRSVVIWSVPLAVALGIGLIAHQFLTRRTLWTWILMGLSAFALSFIASRSKSPVASDHALNSEVSLNVSSAGFSASDHRFDRGHLMAEIVFTPSAAVSSDGAIYLPTFGRSKATSTNGNEVPMTVTCSHLFGEEVAIEAVLGSPSATKPWRVFGYTDNDFTGSEVSVAGWMGIWRTRPVILGELRPELDAEFSHGASRSRVIAIEKPLGVERSIVVEERDVLPVASTGRYLDTLDVDLRDGRRDMFLFVNRAAKRAEVLDSQNMGSVVMNGQVVGFRRLTPNPVTEQDAWRRDAVIVKVRFERIAEFRSHFEASGKVTRPKERAASSSEVTAP